MLLHHRARAPVGVSRPQCDTAWCRGADMTAAADCTADDMADIDQSDSDEGHATRGDSLEENCHKPQRHK